MKIDPTRKVFSLMDEFKAFALKGNVVDLAIAVVIGAAFGKVVDSLVKNLIMPTINLLPFDSKGFEDWAIWFGEKKIPVGLFMGDVVNFLIVALALFLFMVKFLGFLTRLRKEEPQPPAAPTPVTKEQELLTEIRDLLKNCEVRPAGSGGQEPRVIT